jgi:hypothetical protein
MSYIPGLLHEVEKYVTPFMVSFDDQEVCVPTSWMQYQCGFCQHVFFMACGGRTDGWMDAQVDMQLLTFVFVLAVLSGFMAPFNMHKWHLFPAWVAAWLLLLIITYTCSSERYGPPQARLLQTSLQA